MRGSPGGETRRAAQGWKRIRPWGTGGGDTRALGSAARILGKRASSEDTGIFYHSFFLGEVMEKGLYGMGLGRRALLGVGEWPLGSPEANWAIKMEIIPPPSGGAANLPLMRQLKT